MAAITVTRPYDPGQIQPVVLVINWPEEPRLFDVVDNATIIPVTVVNLPTGTTDVLPCDVDLSEPNAATPVCQSDLVVNSPAPGTMIQVDETISLVVDPGFFR